MAATRPDGAADAGVRVESLAREADRPVRSAQPYREGLLAGMADLCAAAPRARDPRVREELGAVFLRVLAAADLDARRRFAERVASAPWVSPGLAMRLAQDAPEVAAPVIGASPALDADALLRLAHDGSPERQAAVARRADLPAGAAAALADRGSHLALVALAASPSKLPPAVVSTLVERSHDIAALRALLTRRPELGPEHARRLAGWVGEPLRARLRERFDVPEVEAEPDGSTDARLVAKLEAAGQLRPGFLLRTLREGRLSLFETALAALGRLAPGQVTAAVRADGPARLALACAAVGLDRSVFPTVLELVRGLAEGRPGDAGAGELAALHALPPAEAAEALRAGGGEG